MEPDRLIVGRVAKAHGIRGEVAVEVLSDAPDRFAPGSRLLAGDRTLTVAASRPHHQRMLVRFEEVVDRGDAEALHGTELTIPSSEALPLDEWSFYPHQLIGFSVVDAQGDTLGKMVRVEESPANDLWVVQAAGKDVYVPAVRDIVRSVDLDARRIVLDPPAGLF